MAKELLPLLSDSLRGMLTSISSSHKCAIIDELRKADALIDTYNSQLYRFNDSNVYSDGALEEIQRAINNLITNEARMLSYRPQTFEFSYLPKGKEPIYTADDNWGRQNRQSAKPSRLIIKLLKNKHSCSEFEEFGNLVKAEMINSGEFKLVSGKDITKFYCEDTYYKGTGMLGNSCMRHKECGPYFEIYEDLAQMLVCEKDGYITGRAIVWTIDGVKYMDRIYCFADYMVEQFVEYAKENKWVIREDNSLLYDGDCVRWLVPEDNYSNPTYRSLYIHLNKVYDYMPYMDTFRYYDQTDNTIYTDDDCGNIYLSTTDGLYRGVVYTCPVCGENFVLYGEDAENDPSDNPPEGMVWSQLDQTLYCEDCAVYCQETDEYIGPNHPSVEVVYRLYRGRPMTEIWPEERISTAKDQGVVAEVAGVLYLVSAFPTLKFNTTKRCWEFITETRDEGNTLRSTATRRCRRSL